MTDQKLKVQYRKRELLTPYENNARTHSDDQIKEICRSIVRFGFTNPILVDEENRIIAGHGRLMAAEYLDIDPVPTITIPGLNDEERRAYILADNKLAMNAGWDMELLEMELSELRLADFDLPVIGFSEAELRSILNAHDVNPPSRSINGDEFLLIVEVDNEEQQEALFRRLCEEKYKVRLP